MSSKNEFTSIDSLKYGTGTDAEVEHPLPQASIDLQKIMKVFIRSQFDKYLSFKVDTA